ncbi:Uncharacterised protein [Mycobacteroides abscessus subsp. abscessus]|nr:Uncharacterised protein [Mycobacteroides abscessus subsp. abscessus]
MVSKSAGSIRRSCVTRSSTNRSGREVPEALGNDLRSVRNDST